MGSGLAGVAGAPEPTVSIDTTTELRWFFDGPLPSEVRSWFTQAGTRGLIEERCDSYRHDGLVDVGVKRRSGAKLELKTRLCAPEMIVLDGASSQLETWRRWSPADDRVDLADDTIWVDVAKTVIKRRFDEDGGEAPLSEATRSMIGQGCDAEIEGVWVGGRAAWSIAFAGFGSRDRQRRHVMNAWDTLMHATSDIPDIDFGRAVPYSYPEWLVAVSSA